MEKPGMGRRHCFRGAGLLILLGFLVLPSVSPQTAPPRLFWRDLPAALTVGEEARLALCISGLPPPAGNVPLPPVPPMAIMEAVPCQGDDEVLAIRVIPLEGTSFSLPSFTVSLGARNLQAPVLRIPILNVQNSRTLSSAAVTETPPSGLTIRAPEGYPLFPANPGKGNILERASALWEDGQVVEALAELRRNERDHPAGFTLVELRRDLEQALGLEQTRDEAWRPRSLLIPVLGLCIVLTVFCLAFPRKRSRQGARGGFRAVSLMCTLVALFCLFRLIPLLPYRGGNAPRQALARDTVVYRVPEDTGTGIIRFRAGQGILVYEIRDGWAYAESLQNGGAGWIKTGTYLMY